MARRHSSVNAVRRSPLEPRIVREGRRSVLPAPLGRSIGAPSGSRSLFLLAMQLARAWAWRNVLRAAYPGDPDRLPAAERRLPGRRRDQRDPPGPRRRRDQGLPRQAPDPALLLSGRHLLLPRPERLRHRRSGSWSCSTRSPRACCRSRRSYPTCPPSSSPSGPNTRRLFAITVGAMLIAIVIAIYVLAHRVRRFWDRVKQGVAILADAAPLPARGGRLAGRRLALPLRRLLVLPRGLRDRRLGRQRPAGDERAGDRQRRPLHARRRRRPAGAPGRDPDRPLAGGGPLLLGRDPDRDGRLVGRPRLRRRSCSSSAPPTGAA